MDMMYILRGFRGSQKPIYAVSSRLSPLKDSEQYNVRQMLIYTASKKVAKTVVSRLQAEGFTPDDYKVHCFKLAVPLDA